MKQNLYIWTLVLVSLSSCFKKEKPIALPIGNSEIVSLSLGKGYEKEMFFDLSTNTFQEKRWADWDIRFDASKNGYGVFINTGKDIIVRKIDRYALKDPETFDTLDYFKRYPELVDNQNGKVEYAGLGDWKNYKSVQTTAPDGIYIIERKYKPGYSRFKRFEIKAVDDSAYYIRITDLYDANNQKIVNGPILTIPKDKNQNFTYYSFDAGIIPNAEPNKNTWDFVFTRYKHIFYNILPNNQPFPYTVSGVLSNNNNVEVAKDSGMTNFEDIDAGTIDKYRFTTNRDGIGYDWKIHAQGGVGGYSIAPKLTYIIKDTDGQYYKLRFLDYNNSVGEPGYPKFEFIRIR